MARGLNKVMLLGNLGSDPEIKYSQSGTAIANLRIATAENRKNSDGEWEERTEWHRLVLFGRQAEISKDYLHKGSKIYIEGRLQTRSWEDQNGQKRNKTEIIVSQLVFLDRKKTEEVTHQQTFNSSFINDRPPENSSGTKEDMPDYMMVPPF